MTNFYTVQTARSKIILLGTTPKEKSENIPEPWKKMISNFNPTKLFREVDKANFEELFSREELHKLKFVIEEGQSPGISAISEFEKVFYLATALALGGEKNIKTIIKDMAQVVNYREAPFSALDVYALGFANQIREVVGEEKYNKYFEILSSLNNEGFNSFAHYAALSFKHLGSICEGFIEFISEKFPGCNISALETIKDKVEGSLLSGALITPYTPETTTQICKKIVAPVEEGTSSFITYRSKTTEYMAALERDYIISRDRNWVSKLNEEDISNGTIICVNEKFMLGNEGLLKFCVDKLGGDISDSVRIYDTCESHHCSYFDPVEGKILGEVPPELPPECIIM